MFCTRCGKEFKGDIKFCTNCGMEINPRKPVDRSKDVTFTTEENSSIVMDYCNGTSAFVLNR